jgi:hypothetical protein
MRSSVPLPSARDRAIGQGVMIRVVVPAAFAVTSLLGPSMASAQLPRDRGAPVPRREEMPVRPLPGTEGRKAEPAAGGEPGAEPATDGEPAPKPAEDGDDGSGFVVVPLVIYSPETHLGMGGFGVHYFRLPGERVDSRVSSVAVVAFATTRRQVILELLPEFYWDDDGFHLDGKLEYQYFPDSFWGIGDRTPDSAEERYLRERVRFRGVGRRRAFGSVYFGLHADVMGMFPTIRETDGVFATQDVPGAAGGFTSGIGPTAQLDTRDNTIESRRGTLLSVTYNRFDGIWGSEYEMNKVVVEARHFFPLWPEHALGVRFYGEGNGGEVPFYLMGMLGGDELLRGYFLGRYRDKWAAAVEAEYRFPIYWLFRGVVFAGAGEVAGRLRDLDLDPVRWAVGSGLRLALNQQERLNLRLDVGVGLRTFGFYLSATEAF